MTARILIVEDEEPLTLLLRYNLEAEGYAVDPSARGDEAELKLKESTPDLVVLDWMLPGLSGIELMPPPARAAGDPAACRSSCSPRAARRASACAASRPAPTTTSSSRSRCPSCSRACARCCAAPSPERVAGVLSAGDIELDRETQRVSRAGREVDLGPTEFRLLEFLMENPGRVFSREQLLDGVWGRDVYIDERTVDVHVGRLRKALNRGRDADPIRTVRGAGYALNDRFGKTA